MKRRLKRLRRLETRLQVSRAARWHKDMESLYSRLASARVPLRFIRLVFKVMNNFVDEDLDVVEFFSGKGAVHHGCARFGMRASGFEILDDACMDMNA